MAGRVDWTDLARTEFDAAAETIGRVSPAYAASFAKKVIERVEAIADWPESGSIVPEFNDPSLREAFVFSYRIIHRPLENGICVVAIIHSARDLTRVWDDAERTGN